MKSTKSKFITDTLDRFVVATIISSFVFGMLAPQTANAETQEVARTLLSPVMEENLKPVYFPIAGDREPLKTINVVSTAYSSDVWQTDDTPCIPASGYNLCEHYEKYGEGDTVAANFLPLGTQVKFPEMYGEKVFIVRDRMNARYGYGRIDIWMPEYEEAKNFGVKRGLVMEIF
ncbi:MAG: 3D domain-containing protein [Candidatus Magasanikbacteria bacterium]|nr:3D domain-containing protein [Candidatus Magasanikbacteria bacterium]